MGTFSARMKQLEKRVGDGDISLQVGYGPGEVAGPQHYGGWVSGPLAGKRIRHYTTPGTGDRYLERPLFERFPRYLQEVAREVIERGPRDPMIESARDLLRVSEGLIPRELGDLRDSGRGIVVDEGVLIHQSE